MQYLQLSGSETVAKLKSVSPGQIAVIIVLVVIGLCIMSSSLSGLINIIKLCPDDKKASTNVNSYGLTFGVGLGVAFMLYSILQAIAKFFPSAPLILLSLIAVVMFSWNTYNLQHREKADINLLLQVNMALVGFGAGLLLGFALDAIPLKSPTLMTRITAMLGCLAAIAFSSLTINAYLKCDKKSKNRAMEANAAIIALAGVIFIVLAISLYFYPA